MIGVLEAIKKGFIIASKSLGLVLVLIVFNMIGNFAGLPFQNQAALQPGQQADPQLLAGALIFTAIFVLVSIFVQGGALALVRDYIKEGKMKLAQFASYGAKYYIRLLGLGVVIIAIIVLVALAATLIVALTAPLKSAFVTIVAVAIAIVIAIVATLFYFIPLSISPYALITEDLGVIASIKRSLAVAKKPFIRVLLLALLFVALILISIGIGLVLGFVFGLISAFMPEMVKSIVMIVLSSIINGYIGVVMMASFMVYYLGLASNSQEGH